MKIIGRAIVSILGSVVGKRTYSIPHSRRVRIPRKRELMTDNAAVPGHDENESRSKLGDFQHMRALCYSYTPWSLNMLGFLHTKPDSFLATKNRYTVSRYVRT